MLAHFEDLDLSPLQLDVGHGHLLLRHDLDCYVLSGLLVNGGLYEAELALAQCLFNVVVVRETRVANNFLDSLDPSVPFLLRLEVVSASLGGREDQ